MKTYTYSAEIASIIKQFLDENDWHYSFDENRGIFDFGLRIKSKIQNIHYLIDVSEDDIVFYGVCPLCADHEDAQMMVQMTEFLRRANCGLKNGCFELDCDGEIRYKSYLDCDGVLPTATVIRNCIYCIDAMYKRYGAGIADIIFAGRSAEDAIDMCENSVKERVRQLLPNHEGNGEDDSLSTMLAQFAEQLGISDSDE